MEINQKDPEGANLVRIKTCPAGWHYTAYGWQFEVGQGGISGDYCSISHDSENTVVGIEFPFDVEIISGDVQAKTDNSCKVDVVVAPHIPEASGGSKRFARNIDLSFNDGFKCDGRSSKRLYYSAQYHSGLIQLKFPIAGNIGLKTQVILEVFEP